jgi:hypothetical protein
MKPIKSCRKGWGRSSVVEHLHNICKALNLIPTTTKKEKKKELQIGQ